MVQQRLPIVNSDDGTWGDILRLFLMKEHYNDDVDDIVNGGHQKITIRAGTATAGTAPLKFTSGSLLTTPEAGAVEFNLDSLYVTDGAGPTRRKVAAYDDTSGATGDIYYRSSSGYFTRLGIGSSNDILTVSSGLPAWTSTPTIGNGSTITVKDANFTIQDDGDTSKQAKFQLSGITTGTTRTYTLPNTSGTLATQTYVNTGGTQEFQHDFSDDTNGNPSTADTGQSFLLSYTAAGGIPTVSSGAWVNNDTTAGFSFSILQAILNATVTYGDVEFSMGAIGSGTTDGEFVSLWVQNNSSTSGLWGGFVPDGLQITVNPFGLWVDKWVSSVSTRLNEVWSGNSVNVYANFPGTARQRVEYVVDKANSTLYVRGADGNIYAFTDSYIGSTNFTYNVAEIGYGTASTDKQIAIYNWSATSAPLMGQSSMMSRGRNLWEEARAAGGVVKRDGHNNLSVNAFVPGRTYVPGANGTTTMDITYTQSQIVYGASGQTIKLPTTDVIAGMTYTIVNASGGTVTVQASDGTTIGTLTTPGAATFITGADGPTTANEWGGTANAAGKTFRSLNSLTLAGTDGTTMTFPSTSGTVATQAYVDTGGKMELQHDYSDDANGTPSTADTGQTFVHDYNVSTLTVSSGALISTDTMTAGWSFGMEQVTLSGTTATYLDAEFSVGAIGSGTTDGGAFGFWATTSPFNSGSWNFTIPDGLWIEFSPWSFAVSKYVSGTGTVINDVASGLGSVSYLSPRGTTRERVEVVIDKANSNVHVRGADGRVFTFNDSFIGSNNLTYTAAEIVYQTATTDKRVAIYSWSSSSASLMGQSALNNRARNLWDEGRVLSSVLNTATPGSIAGRDANANLTANAFFPNATGITTSGGTTTLYVYSSQMQKANGTSTHTIVLPTTGVDTGNWWWIFNDSTQAVTVQSSDTSTVVVMAPGTQATFVTNVPTPTAPANWELNYSGTSVASGKKLTASNTLTLAGTDGTTMTFPSTSGTVATQAYVDSVGKLELQHDFSDDANGNPSTADTGQSLVLMYYPTSAANPTVSSGAFISNETSSGFAMSLIQGTLNATVTYTDVEFSIGAIGSGTTNGGEFNFWLQETSLTAGAWNFSIPDGIELSANKDGFWVDKWISASTTRLNEVQAGPTIVYASSMGTARQRLEVVVDKANSTLYIRGADGNTYTFIDSFIGSNNLPYAIAEVSYNDASTDKRVAVYNWSATSAPLMGQSGTMSRGRYLWEEGRALSNKVTLTGTQTLTNKTLTTPVVDYIKDVNGVAIFNMVPNTSAVNYLQLSNSATGVPLVLSAQGADTDIDFSLNPKGAGALKIYASTGKTPTIQAIGADTNHDLNLLSKGSGKVKANGNPVLSSVTAVGAVTGTPSGSTYLRGDGTWSTLANGGTGMLSPAQVVTVGSETYTISSGTVTQISGTTINGYSPSVGDRVLVMHSPAASGAGGGTGFTSQPGNGVYSVTSNTTNLSLSRTADMSGSVNPAGLSIYVENGTSFAFGIYTVTTPATAAAFTWGTGAVQWAGTGGTYPTLIGANILNEIFVGGTKVLGSGGGIFTLPATATSTLVSRTSTDTLTNKTLDNTTVATIKDTNFTLQDDTTTSKQVQFELSGISASTTRTLTVPDASGTLVLDTATQTLTNKTLTSPKIDWIMDTNGNTLLGANAASSAVNYIEVSNAATGIYPSIFALGSDSDVGITIQPKGAGNALYLAQPPGHDTAVINAQGAGSNINLNLTTKGAGTVQVNGVQVADISSTQTLTNKRVTIRTNTVASSATPTINTDTTDEFTITALAVNITSMTSGLSGTPSNGDELMIRFKDNGSPRTIAWGSSFVSSGVATLLATTATSKTHYVRLRWDGSHWVCLAVDATGY